MIQHKKDTVNNQSIQDWMTSERLYEEYLFYYLLIIVMFIAIGFVSLGFEIPTFNAQENLAVNFIWFLMLATAMAFAPFWYDLQFGKKSRAKKENEIQTKLDNIEDENQRQIYQQYLQKNGLLAPRKLQLWALIFLGWCCLFELFFISSWIRNESLVWQPDLVQIMIDWVHSHINFPPLNINRDIFWLDFKDDEVLIRFFINENNFVQTSYGQVVMLFVFWRTCIFIPIVIALSIVLWDVWGYLGLAKFDPRTIDSLGQFIRCCLWSIVIAFFLCMSLLMLITNMPSYIPYASSKVAWLFKFYINFSFVFVALATRFFSGWLIFWKTYFTN